MKEEGKKLTSRKKCNSFYLIIFFFFKCQAVLVLYLNEIFFFKIIFFIEMQANLDFRRGWGGVGCLHEEPCVKLKSC